jgi:hypothetical protein
MATVQEIDSVIKDSLTKLARDPHVRQWKAKEHNWVSYFTLKYVLEHCGPGRVIGDPTQIGIEVGVPQPTEMKYEKSSVRRDLVIWPEGGMTCWKEGPDRKWESSCHPLAIVEWKVHRPGFKNRDTLSTNVNGSNATAVCIRPLSLMPSRSTVRNLQ